MQRAVGGAPWAVETRALPGPSNAGAPTSACVGPVNFRRSVPMRLRSRVVPVLALAASLAARPLAAQTAADGETCERGLSPARWPEARARVQQLAAGSGPLADFARGCAAMGDGKAEAAAEAFERAAEAAPRSAVAQFWLGRAYGDQAQRANVLRQASLARKTKRAFDRAVELDPDYLDARDGLLQYYLLAPGIMGGSEAKAREQADEIRRRNAYRGGYASVQLLQKRKDWAGVAREMEALVRQYPDSTGPWQTLGLAYGQQGRWDDAWATLDRMGRAMPGAPILDYYAGRLAVESGARLERGEAGLTRYLQHRPARNEPSLATARWRLGQLREKQGRRGEARAEYEAALKLEPGFRPARQALEKVR